MKCRINCINGKTQYKNYEYEVDNLDDAIIQFLTEEITFKMENFKLTGKIIDPE